MPTITRPQLEGLTYPTRWIGAFPDQLDAGWLDDRCGELMAFTAGLGDDVAGWIDAVHWHNEIVSHFSTVAQLARLAFRRDTTDEDASAEFTRIRRLFPEIERHDIAFLRSVLASPALDAIGVRFGESWITQIAVEVALHDPANAELTVQVGDLLVARTRLMGQATFQWRAEQKPLSFAHKASLDPDRSTRRAAHVSLTTRLREIEPELQRLFDEAQALRQQMASNVGASSYADYRYREMGRVDWSPVDAARFRDVVREHFVPIAHDLRTRQAAQNGTELVHPADLEIWSGEPSVELAVPVEDLASIARKMFEEMGDEFAESFGVLADHELLDLEARVGKEPGGSCASLPDQRVTFIFANNTGTPQDVQILVHESGHALQKWRSRHIDLAGLRQPTLEACEVHSTTLELLAHPWAEHFFGDTASTYRRQHLRSQFLAVPYMAAVDDFQHRLYDPSRDAASTAAERAELWGSLIGEYLPGIDWSRAPWYHQNYWLRQHHITTKPFYYIDYALAQVVSWQLWLDSLEDRDSATERYLKLCTLGGSVPFRTMLREANVGDPFDRDVVADVAQRLRPRLLS